MNFATGLKNAYNTKWSYVNTFSVIFKFPDKLIRNCGWTLEDTRNMDLHIKSINTPEFNNQGVESYVGDQWRIQNGRTELLRFTISFRDSDQLSLYRKFVKSFHWSRTDYYDSVKIGIKILKESDYLGEKDQVLFDIEGAMIDSVSQIQFSNETESQVAEFDVQFKCPSAVIY